MENVRLRPHVDSHGSKITFKKYLQECQLYTKFQNFLLDCYLEVHTMIPRLTGPFNSRCIKVQVYFGDLTPEIHFNTLAPSPKKIVRLIESSKT